MANNITNDMAMVMENIDELDIEMLRNMAQTKAITPVAPRKIALKPPTAQAPANNAPVGPKTVRKVVSIQQPAAPTTASQPVAKTATVKPRVKIATPPSHESSGSEVSCVDNIDGVDVVPEPVTASTIFNMGETTVTIVGAVLHKHTFYMIVVILALLVALWFFTEPSKKKTKKSEEDDRD